MSIMNAYKVEAVVAENGTVTLQGLPFRPGETVEVIVLERSPAVVGRPPQGEKTALDWEYLLGVEAQMSEWISSEDEAAYCDL
jgi:hypothetical protein